jgi:hypothetical protein
MTFGQWNGLAKFSGRIGGSCCQISERANSFRVAANTAKNAGTAGIGKRASLFKAGIRERIERR